MPIKLLTALIILLAVTGDGKGSANAPGAPVHSGQYRKIDAALAAGASPNARDELGFAMVHDAAMAGACDAVELLAQRGADLSAGDAETGWTALHWAVQRGDMKMVQLLLDKGADASRPDARGRTPIRLANESGNLAVAELLAGHGAKADDQRIDVTAWDSGSRNVSTNRVIPETEQPTTEGVVMLELLTPRVAPGQLVKVKIVNPPTEKFAWIGFYKVDAGDKNYVRYSLLNALDNNTYEDVRAPDETGHYNFRIFRDESFKPLATSATIEVKDPP
jgi:hypothetical protein